MGSIILVVIMKCLILLIVASSVLGDAEPSADPQFGYGGLGYGGLGYGGLGYVSGQHYGAHQYGAGLPYNFQPQAAPAGVEDAPASAVRLPAPFTGYGPALPYGYAGTHGQGYPGYAGVHGYPGYGPAGYGPAGYANGPASYPGAYQGYTGWPYAAAPAAAAKSE